MYQARHAAPNSPPPERSEWISPSVGSLEGERPYVACAVCGTRLTLSERSEWSWRSIEKRAPGKAYTVCVSGQECLTVIGQDFIDRAR